MKVKHILSLYAACVFLFFWSVLSSVALWQGNRDIELIIQPAHLAAQVVRVAYWSDSYDNIKFQSTQDYNQKFLAAILRDADLDKDGKIHLKCHGGGKKSLLHTYYEHWNDGFYIRIEFSGGRVYNSVQHIEPKLTSKLKVDVPPLKQTQ